jgi:hypothetical protein
MKLIEVHKEYFKHSNNHNLLAKANKYYQDNVCFIAYSIYDLVHDDKWLMANANSYVSYHLPPQECLESEMENNLSTYKQLLLKYYNDTTTKARIS